MIMAFESRSLRPAAVVSSVLALIICGCHAQSSSNVVHAAVKQNNESDLRAVGATGVPIDPSRKTVLVVVPPGEILEPDKHVARLEQQHEKTQADLTKLMKSYARNLSNSQSKQKLGAQMADDLEAYKRQSLELYQVQRQLARQQIRAANAR
jgi:hypothetical protein